MARVPQRAGARKQRVPLVIDRQSWPNREIWPNRQNLPRWRSRVAACWRCCHSAGMSKPRGPPPAFQFRVTHMLLMMAAIGVWLAAWRLQDPVLTFLIILPALALGPVLLWQGHLQRNRELSAAGSVITYAAPVVVVVLIGI